MDVWWVLGTVVIVANVISLITVRRGARGELPPNSVWGFSVAPGEDAAKKNRAAFPVLAVTAVLSVICVLVGWGVEGFSARSAIWTLSALAIQGLGMLFASLIARRHISAK